MSYADSLTLADRLRAYAAWLRTGSPELVDADYLEEAADELEISARVERATDVLRAE
jgi:hypothetical protein